MYGVTLRFCVGLFVTISQPFPNVTPTNGCGQHACVSQKKDWMGNMRVRERDREAA